MTTAYPTARHSTHPTAMAAAAAAAAILGAAGATGFATWQDTTTAGTGTPTSVHQHPPCPDVRCVSPTRVGDSSVGRLPHAGGAMVRWLP